MSETQTKEKLISTTLNVTIVAIDSNYEQVTNICSVYREANVYPYLESKGYRIIKLIGPLARRKYTYDVVKKPEVDYITGVGHGLAHMYTGDQGDPVFEINNYQREEVQGKIAHLLSCETASRLGRDFVANGCLAFFGYDQKFTFNTKYPDFFLECDSEIDIAFADGMNAEEVHHRVINLFNKRITELIHQNKIYVAAVLEFNKRNLRSPVSGGEEWGSKSAKLQ